MAAGFEKMCKCYQKSITIPLYFMIPHYYGSSVCSNCVTGQGGQGEI